MKMHETTWFNHINPLKNSLKEIIHGSTIDILTSSTIISFFNSPIRMNMNVLSYLYFDRCRIPILVNIDF